jgi:hypothetical protein
MRYCLVILLIFVLACGSTSALTETVSSRAVRPEKSLEPEAVEATVTALFEPTSLATPIQLASEEFNFIIISPADGEVVSQSPVEFKVWANAETVLTVNEEIYIIPAQQITSVQVPLEEGPNALEIVASDYAGNEIDLVLTVTYQPE